MNLLDHIERACELVYEALTGKCWHDFSLSYDGDRKFAVTSDSFCTKCKVKKYLTPGKINFISFAPNKYGNPDLANSLDAWRPLWERMDALQRTNHQIALARIKTGSMYMWDFQPIHHLEAALRAIEIVCPECKGFGRVGFGFSRPCTCNNGKITLYKKLKGE